MSGQAPAVHDCPVCKAGVCSFCNGDGYVLENNKMHPCGVCRGTAACQICSPEEDRER